MYVHGDPDPLRARGNCEGIFRPIVIEVGLKGISGVSQSYSVGGSIDAAFRSQYCSNFLSKSASAKP